MRILGAAVRYFLNINTIWGLMILTAFVLCIVQHYAPTRTTIPGDRLAPGLNTLTLQIKGQDGKIESHVYVLNLAAQGLSFAADLQDRHQDRPWLISARAIAGGFVVTWDHDGSGKYEAVVNGALVSRGSLVTFRGLTNTAFDYAENAFQLALRLVASMVLFLGLMKVGEDAGIVQLVARALHPVLRLIFPGIPRDHPANGAVLMNMATGMLGLGNAATPFGLKAMKELQSLNPHPEVATDSQVMMLAWNTGGFAIVSATLIAYRKAAGCSNPFEIIGTCLVAGTVATVCAITSAKLLGRLRVFSVRAALGEDSAQPAAEPELVGTAASADGKESRR